MHFHTTTIIAGAVENNIEVRLRQLGVSATATCPRHVPIVAGSQFACTLRDNAGRAAHLQVTIESSTGAFKLGAVLR